MPDSSANQFGPKATEPAPVGPSLLPDLRFTLVEVLTGVDQLTIVYRNQDDTLVAETLKLGDDGLVNAVDVTYGAASAAG